MFYFTEGVWTPFKNKFTYTVIETTYGNVDTLEGVDNLTMEPITFTEEQLMRWEAVKNIESIGQKQLTKFILEGVLPDELLIATQVEATVKKEQTRKNLLANINIDTVDSSLLIDAGLAKEWEKTSYFVVGEPILYENEIYKVLQSHSKQLDWTPTAAPSLFAKKLTTSDGTPKEWIKPGAENGYSIGDKVIFEGKIYESLIDNNIWSPIEYPQGWYTEPVLEEWSPTKLYKIGEQALYEGKIYESVINDNSWSPAAYAAGWKEIP